MSAKLKISTAPLGSKTNPFPSGTKGGTAEFANKYYFKQGKSADAQGHFNPDEDITQFTAEGNPKGRPQGSINTSSKVNYRLPSGLLKNAKAAPFVPLTGAQANDVTAGNVHRRNWMKDTGLALLASLAPALSIEVGGTPSRQVQRRMTGAEIKAALAKAGIKPNSDDAFEFVANPDNVQVMETTPAVPGGKYTLETLAANPEIEIPPAQARELAEMAKDAVWTAIRDASVSN